MTWWQSLLIACAPAVIAFIASLIAQITQSKRLKKELSIHYGSENELHIAKVKFDTEFEIYRELSDKFFAMTTDTIDLFPIGICFEGYDTQTQLKVRVEKHKKAIQSYKSAEELLMKNAAFIPENQFDHFKELLRKCLSQINLYPDLMIGPLQNSYSDDVYQDKKERFEASKVIYADMQTLINLLREYLSELGNL